jgi:hypothetical protein
MPCYQVQTCNVELNNADHNLLAESLKKQGYTVTLDSKGKISSFRKGSVTGSYSGTRLNFSGTNKVDSDAIKRSYSEEVIQKKAKQMRAMGWEVYKEKGQMVFKKPAHVRG